MLLILIIPFGILLAFVVGLSFLKWLFKPKKCPKCKREMTEMKNKQTSRTAYHCPYCGEHKEV